MTEVTDFSQMELHQLKTELSQRVYDSLTPFNTDAMTTWERDEAIAIIDQIKDEAMELRIRISFREQQDIGAPHEL